MKILPPAAGRDSDKKKGTTGQDTEESTAGIPKIKAVPTNINSNFLNSKYLFGITIVA